MAQDHLARSTGKFWTNGNSEKGSPVFPVGTFRMEIRVPHVRTSFRLLGSTAMPTLVPSVWPRAYLEIFANRSFRKFWANGKSLKTRLDQ